MSSVRVRGAVLAGAAAVTVALSGCAPDVAGGPSGPASQVAGQSGGSSGQQTGTKASSIDIRSGRHGDQERVVFDFGRTPGVSNLELTGLTLDQQVPSRGQTGKPVPNMPGPYFLHINTKVHGSSGMVGEMTDSLPLSTSVAKSAVVNDHSEGTAQQTISLANPVKPDIKVEGTKLIVNIPAGPAGR